MPKNQKMLDAQDITRVTPRQINVARELLDMMYMPSELAGELFVNEQAVDQWIKQGLPHEKDDKGKLWIHGIKAGEWILALRKARHDK